MKTLWTFLALVLATLYHGSHQKPYQSQSSSKMPRILVVTGSGDSSGKMQLWPKLKSQCALPNFPLEVSGAVGSWTAQGPTVCGGYEQSTRKTSKNCFFYKEHQWMLWTNMGTARSGASTIQINPNQALIIGGYGENGNPLKTTELISSSGSKEWNDFPTTVAGHCSFPFNATHAMVTGGYQDGSVSANTWLVDLTTTKVTPGLTMKTKRYGHGCSIFHEGTKSFGIVSGGSGFGEYLDSTEMIDLDQESPEWTEGPKLPQALYFLTLAKTTQGTYAMGGMSPDYRNEVLQLDCPRNQISSCQWKQVGNLQFTRYNHVSIALPESYDICRD